MSKFQKPAIPWNARLFGQSIEARAARYLSHRGLRLIGHNFYCRQGEVDLILEDREGKERTVVFVEVRFRRQPGFGSAAESITYRKQQRIKQAASWYLFRHPQLSQRPCRFDVIAAQVPEDSSQLEFEWIKDAFI